MNLIEPNFSEFNNDIIDAIGVVLGENYKPLIEEKINNVLYISYVNYIPLDNYIYKLKNFKKRNIYISFLKTIGETIEEQETKDKTNEFIENKVKNYFNTYYAFSNPDIIFYYEGILSFKPLSPEIQKNDRINEILEVIIKNQIKFLNFLIGDEEVTIENYEEFKTTIKYKKLLELIDRYIRVFDSLLSEYNEYVKNNLSEYENYVSKERERRKELIEVYRKKALEELKQKENIPPIIRELLENLESLKFDIEYKTNFEYFSKDDDEKLKSLNVDDFDKCVIAQSRLITLKNLGVDIKEILVYSECLPIYEEIIKREDVKKLIPSYDLVETIREIREKSFSEFEREFLSNNPSFKKYVDMFMNEGSRNALYQFIKDNKIMINQYNGDNKRGNILYFSIQDCYFGKIDYVYIHELIHIVETVFKGTISLYNFNRTCGFEIHSENTPRNPYMKSKRKYERLNETITDLFAMEVRKVLHSKGIYFAEPKEIIDENVEDNNTSSILKRMVTPLLEMAREEVIKARMTGELGELYDFLGVENFENLNDIINKVDYLINQGLENKIKKNELSDNTLVIQYEYELKRLEDTYSLIEKNIKGKRGINGFK